MAKLEMMKKPEPKLNLDSVIAANQHLNFIKRAMDAKTPSVMIKGQSEPSTHFMESGDGIAYPTVVHDDKEGLRFMGKYLGKDEKGNHKYDNQEARDYALKTGNYIKFANDKDAQYFAENYKKSKLVKIGK